MAGETVQQCVERLVREYAPGVLGDRPLGPELSLHDDLAIESLALMSLTLRLGNDFGVDVIEAGIELGGLKTLGDLIGVAQVLKRQSTEVRSAT